MTEWPVLQPPPTLRFGASSAAYQIEGAVDEDGRGESIWDRFCRLPGAIADATTGDVGCDHYHRWHEDLDLMRELRLDAYRFSIAWPRVQPGGRGALNQAGVDFYRRLVTGLRERGIEPAVTLYHADLPAELQDNGGWAVRDTADRFADYAQLMTEQLGDLVAAWITHNEPWGVAFAGHAQGTKAPGLHDWATAVQAAHHLLLSHGLAVQALRAGRPNATVGISLNLACARPASASAPDAEAAQRQDEFVNRWFLDPLLHGSYPGDLLARLPAFDVRAEDLETIATPIDFLGINAYHPDYIRAAPGRLPLELEPAPAPAPRSPLGWHIDPHALSDLLTRLQRDYDVPPIWITENGISDDPDAPLRQRLADQHRIDYLAGHLQAVVAAIAAGIDVRRYFVWSLLDSFEWELGHRAPFGLVHVDFSTQRRTPKQSAHWYRDTISRSAT
jgi:beta-glucosidase